MFQLNPLELKGKGLLEAQEAKAAEDRLLALGRAADKAGDELVETGRQADRAKRPLRDVGDESDKTKKKMNKLSRVAKQLFAGMTAAAAIAVLRSVARSVIETGSTFQQLGGAVETAFGEKAGQVFADIRQFALDSPGQIAGITASWVGLRGVGLEPTIEMMRDLDDLASGTVDAVTGQTRSLSQLAEAVRGAATGETERLKAFNILARQSGDEITLTYDNITRTVKRNASEIVGAIREISDARFEGAATRQMGFYAGAVSNLEDALDELKAGVFEQGGVGDALTELVRGATAWVNVVGPGAVEETKQWTQALRDLKTIADALPERSDGFMAKLLANAPIGGALASFFSSLDRGRQELRELADALDGDTEAMEDLENAAAEAQKTLSRADIFRDRAKAQFEEAKAAKALADAIVDLSEVNRKIEDAELSAEIEAQAKAFHKLLDEASPGIEVLRELAKEQIEGEKAAKAHKEELERETKALEDLATAGADALEKLVELKQRKADFIDLLDDVSGASAPDLLPDRLLEFPDIDDIERKLNDLDLDSIWGKFFDDQGAEVGGAVADAIIPAGQEVGSIWSREIKIAGKEVGMTWGDLLSTAVSAVASLARDFGRREEGRFGGNLSGDFADEGAQAGEAAGAIIGGVLTIGIGGIGAPIGAAIGKLIGGVIGGAIKQGADTGLVQLNQIGDEVAMSIQSDEGGLGAVLSQVAGGIAAELNAFGDLLGEAVNIDPGGGGGFKFILRDDVISVIFAGIRREFETIEDAIEGGVLLAVQNLDFGGDGRRPELQAALNNFAGQTFEDLETAMALAFEFEQARMGDAAAAASAAVHEIFAKLAAAIEAGIPLEGGLAMLEQTRNSLLGLEEDIAAQKAAEIDAYNAAIDMKSLEIQAMMLELQARAETVRARGEMTQAEAQMSEAAITADGARIQSLAAVTGAQAQMVTGSASLLLQLQALLGSIEGLRITGAERAAAIARAAARRARRASGRAGGGSPAAMDSHDADRQAIQDRLDAADAATMLGREIAEMAERMRELEGFTGDQIAAMNELMRQEAIAGMDDLSELIRAAGESTDETSLRHLVEYYDGLQGEALRYYEEGILTEQQYLDRLLEIETAHGIERGAILDDARQHELDAQIAAAEEAARIAEESAARREAILAPFLDSLREGSVDEQIADIYARQAQAIADLGEIMDDGSVSAEDLAQHLADLDTIAAGTAAELVGLGNRLKSELRGVFSGAIGTIQTALPHIQDPEQRAQLEATIVRFRQRTFELEVRMLEIQLRQYELELRRLDALNDETSTWIAEFLADLDIIGANMESIFEGIAGEVTGAGSDFATQVGIAGGAFGTQILRLIRPDLLPVLSPGGQTFDEIEQLYGGQLGSLMAQLQALQLQGLNESTDPYQALLDQFQELEPLMAAFGLSMEDITQTINDLREAEQQRLFDATFGSLQGDLAAGGPLSGASNREQLRRLQEQIDAALMAGDYQTAESLARQGLEIAAQTNPRIWAQWRDLILATQIGGGFGDSPGTGTDLPPGGPGLPNIPGGGGIGSGLTQQTEISMQMLNVFEQDAARRRDADIDRERNRGMQTEALEIRLGRVETAVSRQTPFLIQIAEGAKPVFGQKV